MPMFVFPACFSICLLPVRTGVFRPGYCFVALRSAVSFLMDINGAAVGMTEQEFRRYVIA